MSTAFGVTPRYRPAPPPIVKAIDRDAPVRPRPQYSPWSTVEDDVVRERAYMGASEIQRVIPHRSRDAILNRAQRLGVPVKRKVRKGLVKRFDRRATKPIPPHCHPLVRTYVEELNRRMMTWGEAETAAGVACGTFRNWATKSMPSLDTFIAALNVVGLDLKIVPAEEVKPQAFSFVSSGDKGGLGGHAST